MYAATYISDPASISYFMWFLPFSATSLVLPTSCMHAVRNASIPVHTVILGIAQSGTHTQARTQARIHTHTTQAHTHRHALRHAHTHRKHCLNVYYQSLSFESRSVCSGLVYIVLYLFFPFQILSPFSFLVFLFALRFCILNHFCHCCFQAYTLAHILLACIPVPMLCHFLCHAPTI